MMIEASIMARPSNVIVGNAAACVARPTRRITEAGMAIFNKDMVELAGKNELCRKRSIATPRCRSC